MMNQTWSNSYIIRISNLITWYRNYKLQDSFLTSSQGDVFHYIIDMDSKGESATISDIMKNLQLGQSTVSGIVSRLEKKGVIKRVADKNDARKLYIIPTPEGRELEENFKYLSEELHKLLFEGVSDEDTRIFERVLETMLKNLCKIRNDDKS